MGIQNIVGKPVFDLNFFGRDDELDELLDTTEREHVLMLAPRRVGKTSLLHQLAKRAERDAGVIAVYISVSDATNEATFVKKLLDAVYAHKRGKKLKPGRIARLFGKGRAVKSLKVAGAELSPDHVLPPWQADANRAFDAFAKSEVPLLLLIDELPILINAIAKSDPTGERVRAFLQWFRDQRQRDSKVRFVLAGSIGLDNVTRRHSLTDTINDLSVWRLGPFSPEVADEFLCALAEEVSIELAVEVRRAICDAAGWLIPFHLQAVFSQLRAVAKRTAPTVEMVAAALELVLANKSYFGTWEERLADAFGRPLDAAARAVLDVCARDPDGATANTLEEVVAALVVEQRTAQLRWLLDVLHNDGYLVEHDGRWRFRSGLLRRYWTRSAL